MSSAAADAIPCARDDSIRAAQLKRQVEAAVEATRGELLLPRVDNLVDRSPEASCLLKRLNLNDIRARIGRVSCAAGGRGETAERAGATPLFGAFGDPGGDSGAGGAPARRDSKCEPLRAQNQDRNRRNVLHVPAGIPPAKNEVIVASSMGLIGQARRDVDAGISQGLLQFARVHLRKREPSVRTLDMATDFRASAQLQKIECRRRAR